MYSHLYTKLSDDGQPEDVLKQLCNPDNKNNTSITTKLNKSKNLVLDNPSKLKKAAPAKSLKKVPRLTAPPAIKWSDALELNRMWAEYFTELHRLNAGANLLPAVLKADFHGAQVKVMKNKMPGNIGKDGIVIAESKTFFKIIQPDNQIVSIPKVGSVLQLTIPGSDTVVNLYTDQLAIAPHLRITRKIKFRSVEL